MRQVPRQLAAAHGLLENLPLYSAVRAGQGQALAYLDNSTPRWHQNPTIPNRPAAHETISAQILHLVERPDLWHAAMDVAVRRAGPRGRPPPPPPSPPTPQNPPP